MQDQKRHSTAKKCLVALGANLSNGGMAPHDTLKKSLELCESASLTILDVSHWYSTPAFPAGSGPDFVNAAIRLETNFLPQNLLNVLHQIEAELGRTRDNRWEPRICDLDLISYGATIAPDISTFRKWQKLSPTDQKKQTPNELVLPHPRMQDRAFVLVPLNDIAPNWRHPVLELTIAEMLDALPESERAEIMRLDT